MRWRQQPARRISCAARWFAIALGCASNGLTHMLRGSAIVENAGSDGSVVVGKLLESKNTNWGFDAQSGEFKDLVKAGIIDPTKVTRYALQNASSVASLMLTTSVMITELPEEKPEMPAMPPGGGMGGMY